MLFECSPDPFIVKGAGYVNNGSIYGRETQTLQEFLSEYSKVKITCWCSRSANLTINGVAICSVNNSTYTGEISVSSLNITSDFNVVLVFYDNANYTLEWSK